MYTKATREINNVHFHILALESANHASMQRKQRNVKLDWTCKNMSYKYKWDDYSSIVTTLIAGGGVLPKHLYHSVCKLEQAWNMSFTLVV